MSVSENVMTKELQRKLDKISKSLPLSKETNNMVELNPKNQHHKEWFEVDKYRGE